MPTLSLQLLGAFNAERDGRPLGGFATDKSRALLAYLVVEHNRPHRRESLAALLWPDQSDELARQSLRQALSHLKQALGGDDFLLISPQDIQLHPQANVRTDVNEIEALMRVCKGHRHRSITHCLPCMRRQERLLDLYGGDFLQGFPSQNSGLFEEWLILTREHFRQAAMDAHIALANIYEQRGALPAAIHHLREQIRLEPWREEAHRQTMLLLAQTGERSKAIVQYQTCQRILQQELAVTPAAETDALYQNIQEGSLPAAFTPPLPPAASLSFIGRDREQEELADHLADPSCRLVTLLGMGGMGKSHLALEVARAHAGLYRNGIYFIPLVGVDDFLSAIAAALGEVSPDAGARLPELLRAKELLIVLDNFDHLVENSESLSSLLTAAPGLQLIATSRERLRLREEWVYTLEGLSYPLDGETAGAQPFEAVSLFEARAAQVDPHFEPTTDLLADIVSICQLVEGQPLAIELAASAAAERSCAEIAAALRQTFDALAPSLRNFPPRHRSLRAVFEHSWNLLTTDERLRLAELSAFVGGFSAEAAQAVAGTSSEQLAGLVAKSLVRRALDERFSLHESIRQFAAEKLHDRETVQTRHAAFYAALAASSQRAASATLDLLQKDQANLRAAWHWSLSGSAHFTGDLLKGLSLLYSLRGPLAEGEALFSGAIQHLSADPAQKDLAALISLELARLYSAQARYEEAIDLARRVSGSRLVQAKALLVEGQALDAQGECEAARPVLEKSLGLARQLGERYIEADSLRELGNAANRLAEYDLAVPLYAQALALAHELGDQRGQSATLNNLASVEWDLGELDKAQAHYLEALALYRALGNRLGEAKALNNLSNVAADRGDLSDSLQYCEQALTIHREMANPRGQSAALNNLGATYFSLGNYHAARKNYILALALHRQSGNRQAEGETLANLSLLDCVQGDLTAGRTYAEKAIGLSGQAGDKVNLANALYYLGQIELAEGNLAAAEDALERALAARGDVPHPGRVAEIHAELALCAMRRSDQKAALAHIAPILDTLNDPEGLDGTDEPYRVYAISARVLAAKNNEQAESIRKKGVSLLQERADRISDPALRASFLEAHQYPGLAD